MRHKCTYILFRILDALFDLGDQLLQDPIPVPYCWKTRMYIKVEQISVDPCLDVCVSQKRFWWPCEEVGFE